MDGMTESAPFNPLQSASPLIVYIDFKSPYAYIAKDPTYELARDLGMAIDWRPLTLDIPSYLGSAKLDDTGKVVESKRTPAQWHGVRYAYRDARRYASLRGLTLRGTTKIWDSSLAAIAMLWAKPQGADVLHAYTSLVYDRFWKRELDIEDPQVLERILAEAGAEVSGFEDYLQGPGRELHDHMQDEIFAAGIYGVPTYVVTREVGAGDFFFGREHLPMVRWLLTGSVGAAPDIAYRHFGDIAI
jgi:2-hydroxychromene-2-carboxylate isomerase